MIKIAICDDDLDDLKNIVILINQYCTEKFSDISCTAYQSPLELLSVIEKGEKYDIIFLDVLMPGENGIETAREIRNIDNNVKIIFLTSSPEFAVTSYTVKAFYYQLKPVWKENFFRLMEQVRLELNSEKESGLLVKCKNGIARIAFKELEYCEVIGKSIYFHMANGSEKECCGSLKDISKELLSQPAFIQPHRSYIINMDFIQSLSYKCIELACLQQIPIPRGKYNEIKSAFMEYSFPEDSL